jgi:LuxR family maltose regulon positive regulatory protein
MMCRRGPEDALARSAFAVEEERIGSPWRPMALIMHGSASLMVGEGAAADEAFAEAVGIAPLTGATTMVPLANRALLALARGEHRAAEALAAEAESDLRHGHFAEIVSALLVYAAMARVALAAGDVDRARAALARAQVLRPLATHATPWFSVQSLVELGRAHLALADPAGARRLAREAETIVRVRPALGTFVHALWDLRRTLAEEESVIGGASSLTTAELRLLPLLPTYLTFQEIADRLYVSRNTVKTQALSLYGKLGATSRGEAVENAVRLGLIEQFPALRVALEPESDRAGSLD